jgi:O-antigen ligase
MFKEKNLLFIIFSLIVIYFSQGVFYATGSIVSQFCLFSFLALSGIYLIKLLLIRRKKDLFFKAWTALLLINFLGFIFSGYMSNLFHFGMFKGILISSLPFYPIYYFSQKNMLISKHLIIFFFVMLIISILQFYYNREQILLERISDNENVVNNVAYMFVNLIPFVFLMKKRKIISLFAMLILVFFIIQGFKRGAILIGFVGVLIFLYYQLSTIDKKHRAKGYLIATVGVVILGYFIYNFYLENEFLSHRMRSLLEGDSSQRDSIYFEIFNEWYNSDNLLNIIFGFGFASSQKITDGMFAHNDWLELLSNFGLLGVSIYLLLFYSAFKLVRNPYWDSDKRILFISIIAIWFLTTLFSMAYTSTDGYLKAIILAYMLGGRQKNLV